MKISRRYFLTAAGSGVLGATLGQFDLSKEVGTTPRKQAPAIPDLSSNRSGVVTEIVVLAVGKAGALCLDYCRKLGLQDAQIMSGWREKSRCSRPPDIAVAVGTASELQAAHAQLRRTTGGLLIGLAIDARDACELVSNVHGDLEFENLIVFDKTVTSNLDYGLPEHVYFLLSAFFNLLGREWTTAASLTDIRWALGGQKITEAICMDCEWRNPGRFSLADLEANTGPETPCGLTQSSLIALAFYDSEELRNILGSPERNRLDKVLLGLFPHLECTTLIGHLPRTQSIHGIGNLLFLHSFSLG